MKIDLTSTIYIVAAAQALLLIFVIARKKKIHFSEKYLLGVLLAVFITLLHYVFMINRIISWTSPLMNISAVSWFAISPLLYLYARSLIQKDHHWSWKNLIYFPFSIYLSVQILFALCGYTSIGFHVFFENGNTYTTSWILAYLLTNLFFSILSIRVLQTAKLSDKHRTRIKWIVWYFYTFASFSFLLAMVLAYCLNASYFMQEFEFILLALFALFVFSLIFISLRFSSYFNILSNTQYGSDKKENLELEKLHLRLKKVVEQEKLYLNVHLSLSDLSKASAISENQLSQVFNQHLNSNFYRFINQYRLQEFERQIESKDIQQYTIMAIAESSGFHSKATFYKIFKEHYGMTPASFIKQKKN